MKTRKLTIPYIIWMLVFTMIPIVMIGITAFTDKSGNFSLANFQSAFHYSGVFTKSLLIALISTAICLVVAYPLAYMMTRMKKSTQNTVIMLIMIPMWMNFLLRIYAWVILLQKNGPIDSALSMLGIHGTYIGNTAAVLIMLVLMLPFFFFAMYEKDGLPAEKLLFNRLRFMLWPKERPYKTNNLYQYLSKKEVSAIAKNQTAGGAGKKIAAKHHAVKTAPRRR